MRSLAVGAILVGIVSVVAALTLLPAVLGLLGDKVNALRIPVVGRGSLQTSNPEGRFWGAIVRRVLRRPGLSLALSAGLLLALALPVFRIDTGTSGVSVLPDRFASKQGYLALERAFPGTTTDPAEIVVSNASATGVPTALAQLRRSLATDPRFGEGELVRSADGEVALLRPHRRRPLLDAGNRRRARPPLGAHPGRVRRHRRGGARRRAELGEHRLLRLRDQSCPG